LVSGLSDDGSRVEVTQHPHFERHWRAVQRIIFGFMSVLLLAGVLGLLGSGPLARAAVEYPDAKVEVQRFGRAGAPQQIAIEPGDVTAGRLIIQVDKELATKLGLEAMAPAPSDSSTGLDGTQFIYAATAGGGAIALKGKPEMPGLVRGVIAVNGHSQTVTQIVWP
jgi:hypothetical protein